jgi:hypothetical protein
MNYADVIQAKRYWTSRMGIVGYQKALMLLNGRRGKYTPHQRKRTEEDGEENNWKDSHDSQNPVVQVELAGTDIQCKVRSVGCRM